MSSDSAVNALWFQILPLVMLFGISGFFFAVNILLSIKKGQSAAIAIILSLIPFVGFFLTLWLLCLPNKDIASSLRSMKKKLGMPL
jgi:hypothetical protein